MIYKFTNVHGVSNYGVIFDKHNGGLYVLMDTYQPLKGVTLPARYRWVSLEPNPFVIAKTINEVLPVTTPVEWTTPLIAEAHKAAKAGTLPQWFSENQSEVYSLINSTYS
jgi:hypothetical protein